MSMVVAVAAATLLLSQYLFGERDFPLKTGPALFAALVLMLLAAMDSVTPSADVDRGQRMRLVGVLCIVFGGVVVAKSLMWHAAVQRLSRTLATSGRECLERDAPELAWLRDAPYRTLDNWALPSLVLVTRDAHPQSLVLEPGDCGRFRDTGILQVDPWTRLPTAVIVPALGQLTPPRSARAS